MFENNKIGGIICDSISTNCSLIKLCIGMGININNISENFLSLKKIYPNILF